jgi:phosphatidylinositol alpha-1,6-mannosyltransferase
MAAASQNRVLLLTPAFSGADGISLVSRLIAGAVTPDHALEVWSLGDAEGALQPGWRAASGSKLRFCGWALEESLHSLRGATVIVLHLNVAPVALSLAERGARVVVFLHGVECWRPLTRLQKAALRKASLLMSNSEYTAQRFKLANPEFATSSLAVCHPGIPDLAFPPASVPAARPDALIVGRMVAEERYKGHDQLLELWPKLLLDVPAARLLAVGDGDDRQRLQEKARALGLGEAVCFLGKVPDEELLRLYSECACFVMPSRGEGFGLVFLEAMRAGKPCILGPGASAEIVEDGASGLIVDPSDSERLLACLRRLFTDAALRAAIGAAARAEFLRRFTDSHFRQRCRAALGIDAKGALCAG